MYGQVFSRIRAIFKNKERERTVELMLIYPSVARNNIRPQVCSEIEGKTISFL